MTKNSKDTLHDLGISLIFLVLCIFCGTVGIDLFGIAGTIYSPLALLAAVSGAINLVVSACSFILLIEFGCRGLSKIFLKNG